MQYLLSIGIDVAAAMIVLVPVFACLSRWMLKQRNGIGKIMYWLFAFYLVAVFSVTGLPWFRPQMVVDLSVNLIPLVDIFNSPLNYIRNSVLNVVLFIPVGLFLPLLWKEFRELRKTVVFGFGLSLGIELLQIFTFRLTDVDDLIMNTLGCLVGFFISERVLPVFNGKITTGTGNDRLELSVLMGSVCMVWFTVQPWLAGYIWEKMD